jgi:hypothetical protein
VLGALQGEHLRAVVARDHNGIHLSAADRPEHFLRLGQASSEIGEFTGLRRANPRYARDFGEA